jgi:hypothetical protein
MRSEGHPLPEGLIDIGYTFPLKVRLAGPGAKSIYTVQAGVYLGNEDYEVLQVMICDKQGRFPDEAGCEAPFDVPTP